MWDERASTLALGAPPAALSVDVKNTGARSGDEVVQCYFTPAPGTLPASLTANKMRRQLFAFERLAVGAGATETFAVELAAEQLAVHNDSGDLVLYPGSYQIQCTNGNDQKISQQVHVQGTARTLERF